jgi:hypothetical protein
MGSRAGRPPPNRECPARHSRFTRAPLGRHRLAAPSHYRASNVSSRSPRQDSERFIIAPGSAAS